MNLTNFYYIFLFFGISQGIFLSIAIPSTKTANHPGNKELTIMMVLATIMLSGRILYFFEKTEWVIRLAGLIDTTIFLFGPLVYRYILRFSKVGFSFSKLHFLPAVLHLIYCAITFTFSLNQLNKFYFEGSLKQILLSIEGLGIVSLGTYLVLSLAQLKNASPSSLLRAKKSSSIRRYLFYFATVLSTLTAIWLASFLSTVSGVGIAFIGYDTFWIITPVVFYLVGYFSLSSPEILRSSTKKQVPDRLNAEEIAELEAGFKFLIEEKQIYLDSDLTLKDFAEQLGTSPNNLSWYLNRIHQKSFYDFINQIRIGAFQAKINKREHQKHTLLALAMDVGFKSKSTFNKAFKSLLGNTPSDYVKNHSEYNK